MTDKPPSDKLSVPGTPLTYASYLKIEELLTLQQLKSDPAEHDETLFIVVHQVYELWFKQILHEMSKLERSLIAGDTGGVLSIFKRILTVLKTLVGQVDVIETMTPIEFSSFRSRLESASGFQSLQFRMIEMKLGKRDPRVLEQYRSNAELFAKLELVSAAPSLFDHFVTFLQAHAVDTHDLKAALIQVYRSQSPLSSVCERMVDLDEGFQEWRYRHVKMVERTIGFKRGTGGSAGADYLRTTLFQPFFPDLWAIRTDL